MYREINPDKIRQARGKRTRAAIVQAGNGELSEQNLYGYEKGKWQPSKQKLPHLLNALGASYDDISDPVELALN